MHELDEHIKAFCLSCKAPRPLDWTTGNKSLDSFIMKSWSNINSTFESYYIQWIEYDRLTNIQEMSLLDRGCTHAATWLELTYKGDKAISVALKKIVDGQNAQLFDFYQVNYLSLLFFVLIEANIINIIILYCILI